MTCSSRSSFPSASASSAVLPLLAAKQRVTDAHDWMSTDAEVACPDPNCPTRLRIVRTGKRRFRHADTSAVPLPPGGARPSHGDDSPPQGDMT